MCTTRKNYLVGTTQRKAGHRLFRNDNEHIYYIPIPFKLLGQKSPPRNNLSCFIILENGIL